MNRTKIFLICTSLISLISINGCSLNTRVDQLEAKIDALDACVADLEVCCPASAPTRFVDNGDGTICDHLTGLMWEKKNAADGIQDLANPHDVDNRYTWSNLVDNDSRDPDGSVFSDFLARVNGDATDDPNLGGVGFAGYKGWRLPTNPELQTLLFERFPCSIQPCIVDPIFDPTATAAPYWSSTSKGRGLNNAWMVNFFNGGVNYTDKIVDRHVRAVRGSSGGYGHPDWGSNSSP